MRGGETEFVLPGFDRKLTPRSTYFVIPAKAGTQGLGQPTDALGPRFRGDDENGDGGFPPRNGHPRPISHSNRSDREEMPQHNHRIEFPGASPIFMSRAGPL